MPHTAFFNRICGGESNADCPAAKQRSDVSIMRFLT
jgi:hypothetical protein